MAERKVIDHLLGYIEYLKQHDIHVEDAFLFGSYVENNIREESDKDVILVSSDFDKKNDALAGRVWRLTKVYDEKIEPVMIGSRKFQEDDVSPLLINIRREAVPIK